MISEIQIENFKSIAKLSLPLGCVNVLIGENGSGKSNILEAITFAAAASADKLDDEFLFSRGIRVTDKVWMRSAFVPHARALGEKRLIPKPISIGILAEGSARPFEMRISQPILSGKRLDRWHVNFSLEPEEIQQEESADDFLESVERFREGLPKGMQQNVLEKMARHIVARRLAAQRKRKLAPEIAASLCLRDFLIYAPENTALRNFESDGAIKPLGIKGEGLLKLLADTAANENGAFTKELTAQLQLLGWFRDLRLPSEEDEIRGRLCIQDRWLKTDGPLFDQRSANEGFLYLLFYFTLFLSKLTPKFFAIDNIDNALNPKLCAELMRQLATLAAKNGKQVICTTHNPAILDGLNLHDDQQRLFVVRRNSEGHTVVNRVKAPRPRPDGPPIKLSAAFMSGLLGGLPEHF